jgi:peroxiredoxin
MDSPLTLAGLGAALTVSYCLGARSSTTSAGSSSAGPTIAVGSSMPSGDLQVVKNAGGAFKASAESLFKGRTVVLFAVPGAFTPTCSERHLPSFVEKAAELNKAGVHEILCLSCNDAFVMEAWGLDAKTVSSHRSSHRLWRLKQLLVVVGPPPRRLTALPVLDSQQGKVTMVADEDASYTTALGLTKPALGGIRSQRYAAVIVDGVVQTLEIEEVPLPHSRTHSSWRPV